MGTRTFDLTGTWRGHYEQHGGHHGIVMTVAQKGSSFVGAMRDADTLTIGATPIVQDAADGQAQVVVGDADTVASLPERSVIEGSIDGTRVEFVKRYVGKHTVSFWFRGQSQQVEIADHSVWYEGLLDEPGAVLRGHWRIPARGATGVEAVGAFTLQREAAGRVG